MPKNRRRVVADPRALPSWEVEHSLGVGAGQSVTAVGFRTIPWSPGCVGAYYAYFVVATAMGAIVGVAHGLEWAYALLIFGTPMLYLIVIGAHKWSVVASGQGIMLFSRRGQQHWVPWSDVTAVRDIYGVRGGKGVYNIEYRGGYLGMAKSPASARIAEAAGTVVRARQLGFVVPAGELERAIPADSALSRAAPGLMPDDARAISAARAPTDSGEPAES